MPHAVSYLYFWWAFQQLDILFSVKFVMLIGSFSIRCIFALNEPTEEQWWMQNHKNFWKICVLQTAVNFPILLLKCHYVYIWLILCLDIGKIVGKTVVQIRNEVLDFVRVLVDQVKALPVYGSIKEQYKHVSKFLFISYISETELTCT